MTLPPALQAMLLPDETVLWEGKPEAPKSLSAYKGPHDLIARAFFGFSALATAYFILTQSGAFGLTWALFAFVAGPILIGLIVRNVGARRARRAMRTLHYAVTSQRVVIYALPEPISYTILPDSPAMLVTERRDKDLIILSTAAPFPYEGQGHITPPIYTAPVGMVIAKGEATLAMMAIQGVKDMA